jgi:environmental stress-induced protein Ves
MRWKNGLGTTTEIAVHPPGASLDAFTWRVSIADLAASGPFSTFAGYDRILVQIEGAPMTLSHAGRGEHRLTLLSPYRFAGELDTVGVLDPPPARDFNVMVRRDRASAEVSMHALAAGATVLAEGNAETRILYVLHGALSVEADGEQDSLVTNEALIATSAARLGVIASSSGATVIVVAVGPPGAYAGGA